MIHDTQGAHISQKQDELNTYINVIMKTMCPPGYHHNGFVATHALGHIMYGYTLLVPMNQRVLNKLSKEHNVSGHKWSMTHRVLKSRRSKMSVIHKCMLSWKQYALPVNPRYFYFTNGNLTKDIYKLNHIFLYSLIALTNFYLLLNWIWLPDTVRLLSGCLHWRFLQCGSWKWTSIILTSKKLLIMIQNLF